MARPFARLMRVVRVVVVRNGFLELLMSLARSDACEIGA